MNSVIRVALIIISFTIAAAAADPTVAALRVTELMYHSANPTAAELAAGGTSSDDNYDFIEFQNIGSTPLQLGGTQISLAIVYTFPNYTLAPGAYVVVAKHLPSFAARYGASTPALGPFTSGNFSNGSEPVRIIAPDTTVIQEFTYFDTWYPSTDGSGPSLVMLDPALPVSGWNDVANWSASALNNGSPNALDGAAPTTQPVTYSVPPGSYSAPITVALGSTTSGAQIRYTLDGTDPTEASGILYGSPFIVDHTLTVKAIAFKTSYKTSVVTSAAYVVAAAPDPAIAALRVTELMYHSANPTAAELAAGGTSSDDNYDFIEFQNIGSTPLQLGGTQISLAIVYTFPNYTLAPGAYVVVAKHLPSFAARYGASTPALGPFTSGNFSNGSEPVRIIAPDTTVIQEFTYFDTWYPSTDGSGPSLVMLDPALPVSSWNAAINWSASALNGGSPGALDAATPTAQPVAFSAARGLYDAPFTLSLSTASVGAQISYTLNGDVPTSTTGSLYSGPLTIDRTTTIRAVAFKAGYNPSAVATATYIFTADVINQSPNGESPNPSDPKWPTTNVNGQYMNYGMDPQIVNDPRWSAQMQASLHALPSISLVTDLDNLFSPVTGIYVNALMDGNEWERPTSVELINPDGTAGFQVNAGLRIRGGYSRHPEYAKHGLRLFFRSEYGASKLNYPLFGAEATASFDKIDLRCEQNYAWHIGDARNTMIREVFARDSQLAMGQPATHSRYVHLYLNGQYWGLYMTEERPEASFGASYFGGDKDDYDVVKCEKEDGHRFVEATDGTLDSFNRLHTAAAAGFVTDEAYFRVQGLNTDGTPNPAYEKLVDVDNLIDYVLTIYHGGDKDAPISLFYDNLEPNNFYAIYNRANPNGFIFIRHDGEHTLDVGEVDRTGPFPAGEQEAHFNPQWLHQQMTANRRYRERFGARARSVFGPGGLLSDDAVRARLQARKDQVDPGVISESARWGDAAREPAFNYNDWTAAVANVFAWASGRADVVLAQLSGHGWIDANGRPTAAVTSPTPSDSMVEPAGFTITASAADSDGTVTQVEFFANGTSIGIDADGSDGWHASLTNLPAALYTLQAFPTDNEGSVGKSPAVGITVSPNGPIPYSGTPMAIPGTIVVSHYDNGGEGAAYHDIESQNLVSAGYRPGQGVDTADGAQVDWIADGEWLQYTVNVAASGLYTVTLPVSSPGTERFLQVSSNGADLTGVLKIPGSGSGSALISLSAGIQALRFTFFGGSATGQDCSLGDITVSNHASVLTIPGTIQAEDFDQGADGVAYHDIDAINSSGWYRSTGVDIEPTGDVGGGYNVGLVEISEWLAYTINVPTPGAYDIDVRVAALGSGATFHIEVAGVDVTGSLSIPDTGSFQSYQTVSQLVHLNSGIQTLRVAFDTLGQSGFFGNINYLTIAPAAGTGNQPPSVVMTAPANNAAFSSPADVTLNAVASDNDGAVAQVEFFQNGSLLGADTTSPYSFAWNVATTGSYALTARATDNTGAQTTSVAINITVNPAAGGQSPYSGTPMAIPGTILTAQYDLGGEGIAYHDVDATNRMSGSYRPGQGVDSNGTGVGWIVASEWLEYTVTVSAAGTYLLSIPVSHPGAGGTMRVSFNDVDLTGPLTIPNTGDWGAYQNIVKSISLNAGTQIMRVAFDTNGSTGYGPGLKDIVITAASGNQPPVVAMNSPANNATFTAPANITLNASASDGDGAISQVEFFQNGSLLATDTTSPYSFGWNVATTGPYALTARATDNTGAQTTSAAINITVNPAAGGQSPYSGTPMAIPGTILTAEYDVGGENIAYHDVDTTNRMSGSYRPGQGVDSNGTGVGWIVAGEWLEYTVNVASSGAYAISIPISHPGTGGTMHVSFDGVDVTGSLPLLNTGDWGVYQNIVASAQLTAGVHVMQVSFDTNGSTGYGPGLRDIVITDGSSNTAPNVSLSSPADGAVYSAPAAINLTATASDGDGTISKVEFYQGSTLLGSDTTSPYSFNLNNLPVGSYVLSAKAVDNSGATVTSNSATVTVAAANSQTPYNGTPTAIPGTILSAEYDNGGEGVAFHDTDSVNQQSSTYRPGQGVDSPGSGIGWIVVGEWLEYTVNVGSAGAYAMTIPVSMVGSGASMHVSLDGVNVTGALSVPNTGDWATVQNITKSVNLNAGTQVLRVSFDIGNASGYGPGMGDIAITFASGNQSPAVAMTAPTNNAVFTAPAMISLSADASDSDGTVSQVEFFQGGVLLGADTTSPYSFAWNGVATGSYTLTARATDNTGSQSVSAPISVAINAPSGPFDGTPVAIPGTIQAENFDQGGESTAYHDNDSGNNGGQYRSTGVDIEATGDAGGGYNVGWIQSGEWIAYSVNVETAGAYDISARVASAGNGGSFHIEAAGANVTGAMTIPNTGAWQSYQTVTRTVHLNAGAQILKFVAGTNGVTGHVGNLNYIAIVASASGGNIAPAVGMTSPANGATFAAPANITLAANAFDGDGTVSQVEFFQGGTLLGADATSPYSFLWNGVAAGSYNLTARATDNAGAQTTSAPVAVIVTPPDGPYTGTPIAIPGTIQAENFDRGPDGVAYQDNDSGNNGGQYRSSGVDIEASADAGGGYNVGWMQSGEWLAYSVNVQAAGDYDIIARVASAGNGGSFHIEVNGVNVTGAMTIPNTGAWQTYQTATKNGVHLNAGAQILKFVTDTNGATGYVGNLNFITIDATPNSGNIAPAVGMTAPANGSIFTAPAIITLTADASDSDGTVSQVEFFQGGTLLGTDTTSPYSLLWDGVVAGSYNLTARATDNAGTQTTSASIAITVSAPNQAPSVAMTAPANNAISTAPAKFTVSADASDSDGMISQVEFFQNGTLLDVDTTSPYSVAWSGVPEGTYTLTARATDNMGSQTISASIKIGVAAPNQPPAVAITAPAVGTRFEAPAGITLSADASDGDGSISQVEFFEGGNLLGAATTSPYSFDWNGVAPGTYSLTARATDNAGAQTVSAPININVSAQSPFNGTPFAIPGAIATSQYDNGGEGIAYHDVEVTNLLSASFRRGDGVDANAGTGIRFIKAGEWMEFTVNVSSSATYSLSLPVGNTGPNGTLHVSFDGVDVSGALSVPDTGSLDIHQDVTASMALSAGAHVLRIDFDIEGTSGFVCGLADEIVFTPVGAG